MNRQYKVVIELECTITVNTDKYTIGEAVGSLDFSSVDPPPDEEHIDLVTLDLKSVDSLGHREDTILI